MSRSTLAFLILALVASPLPADALLPADRPIPEVIDHHVDLKLRQAGVTPAPQADDATLVRRLTLDLAGRIPTPAEARGYIDSKDPEKRAKLIDRLMASPDFVRHGATEFDALLRSGNDQAPSLRGYLLVALKENRPWDRMFRELMGSSPDPNRPDHFVLKRLGDPDVLTRDVSSVFFGLNVMCAQCHKHPYVSSITQDYYHGMKAFFSRTIDFQGSLWEKRHALVQYKARSGQLRTPRLMFLSGTTLDEPKADVPDLPKAVEEENRRIEELRKNFAKGKQYPPKPAFSYREQLVEVALRPGERERFARSIVNRLWHRFHGHGLVMRLDQMHPQNLPSHPELLDWLARDLVAHGYDLRRLVRGLVASRTYSRASTWEGGSPPAPALFAVAQLRPLAPMQFGLSALVAGDPDSLPADLAPEARDGRLQALEAEAQKVFGPIIEQPRDGMEINVSEGLRLSNDETVLRVLGDRLAGRLLKAGDRRSQIETAVWAVLSRPPTEEEIRLLGEYVARRTPGEAELARQDREARERREAVEQAKARAAEIEREMAELNKRHREETLRAELARTEKYLAAVAELRLGPTATANTPEMLAARHGLDAVLLGRWHAYLGRPGTPRGKPAADVLRGHFTTRMTKAWGQAAVNGWGSEATPWLVANASNEPIRYGTLTLPPRGIATHPSPTLATAVSWRSPIDGAVSVSGRVADVDPNCGNGVGWSLVLTRGGQKERLAGGVIDNGRSVVLDPAALPALAEVRVRRGDVLSLVVDPREGLHACDSTHVELTLTDRGGKGRKWDLATDVVDSMHAGNPHADGQGNAGVWHFHTVETTASSPTLVPTIPAGSVLARWADALTRVRQRKITEAAGREELSRIAAETARVLTASPPAGNDPSAALFREVASANGPLFEGLDFSASLDAGAKAKLSQWNAELTEARREAARPLPPTTADPPAQRSLRQMAWALLAGAEFRFNH